MRKYPARFQKVVAGRTSDFGGTPDAIEDIGTLVNGTPSKYAPGANLRHLSQEERTAQDLSSNEDGIEISLNYTPVLSNVTPHEHQVVIMGATYQILRVDREMFGNRKIKFVLGRTI